MPRIDGSAACRRGFAYIVAITLCLGPTLIGVRAQEAPAAGSAAIASAGETVLLREQPGYDAPVLATLSDGSALDVTSGAVTAADGTSWLPVVAGGQSGYVPSGYVAEAPAVAPEQESEPSAEPVAASSMTSDSVTATLPHSAPAASSLPITATTTDANLRSGPSADAEVLAVLPPGTSVSINGVQSNGFTPVTSNGIAGWIAVELLAQESDPAAPLPAPVQETPITPPPTGAIATPSTPAPVSEPVTAATAETATPTADAVRGESTGIVWPFSGGEWEVVQGYNNGTHTNRSSFAQYKYSLDWARVDGNTAGQPVYAPVSGTVRWVDRGSGGMLVDVGNGYGVAVFHVTLNRDLNRGGAVERGQRIGTISGPGGEGYMSMAHIDITVWRLTDGGHESTPFVGPNAIAGQEFPDSGGANQHMGARVTP